MNNGLFTYLAALLLFGSNGIIAAAIATFLGTIAAIGIHNMGRRAKAAYLTVNNIPMSSSDTIMGVTFMLLFAAIGLDKGYLTLILAHVTFCTPYVVLNVMPKLRQLDKNAYEAALDLGATPHQALHQVILPEICLLYTSPSPRDCS